MTRSEQLCTLDLPRKTRCFFCERPDVQGEALEDADVPRPSLALARARLRGERLVVCACCAWQYV